MNLLSYFFYRDDLTGKTQVQMSTYKTNFCFVALYLNTTNKEEKNLSAFIFLNFTNALSDLSFLLFIALKINWKKMFFHSQMKWVRVRLQCSCCKLVCASLDYVKSYNLYEKLHNMKEQRKIEPMLKNLKQRSAKNK
jgi:hypothetical protein